MNFEDEEEWDLDLLDKLVQSEERAIAARRSASQPPPLPLPPSPLSLSLRRPPLPPLPAQDDALDLKQRLLQAEQELSELRRKALHPTVVATSTLEQELRRLQSEILFKDQEILEARRACTEKSEQLKRAIAETEELRKGSEDVKRVKCQTNVSVETKHKEQERREKTPPRTSKTSLRDVADSKGPPNQELWCPPWTVSEQRDSSQGASKSKNSSPQAVPLQCTPLDREDPESVKELKTRVLDTGCTSSGEKEIKTRSSQLQQVAIARVSNNGSNIQGDAETMRGVIDNKSWKHLFLRNLLNIWCPRNMKEESSGILSKVLAVCEADMQILLSMNIGEAGCSKHLKMNRSLSETSPLTPKKAVSNLFQDGIEGGSASSGTHSLLSIIAKVASGLVSSWELFVAVWELCEVDNIQVSESALRVLHCILIHDERCQSKIFGRNCFRPLQPQQELQKSKGSNQCFEGTVESNASLRGFEGFIGAGSPAHVLRRYFSSPRITWHNELLPPSLPNVHDVPPQKSKDLQMTDTKSEQKNSSCISSVDFNQGAWSAILFERILLKAVVGSCEAIKITAMSILVALVMNAEPMHEREHFGFVLFDGSMASLLRISASLSVRLQGVRLVHSLLHCPPVLKKLLDMQDKALASATSNQFGGKTGPMQELDFDARNSEENVVLQNGKEKSTQSDRSGDATENCSFEVLEGLISCLLNGDRTSQAYSLRRNALRVLTFVATSGQKGAAFLLAKEMALNKSEVKEESNITQSSQSPAVVRGSLPVHLIALLDKELKTDEDRGFVMTRGQIEERDCVIQEALTLVCRLASHSTHSSNTLAAIAGNKEVARLSISVTNRLMSRCAFSEMPRLQGKSITSPVDMIELCRGLRRRILANISNLKEGP